MVMAFFDVEYNLGCTLLFAACYTGQTELVQLLLDIGKVDVNKASKGGRSPLFVACYKGHHEVVKILPAQEELRYPTKTKEGTPFIRAYTQHHHEIVKLLLRSDKFWKGEEEAVTHEFFLKVCKEGYDEIIELFLEREELNPNYTDSNGVSSFIVACYENRPKLMRRLLNNKRLRRDGDGLLLDACKNGFHEIVELLIQRGDRPQLYE
jgi:ankyrin repeat protein